MKKRIILSLAVVFVVLMSFAKRQRPQHHAGCGYSSFAAAQSAMSYYYMTSISPAGGYLTQADIDQVSYLQPPNNYCYYIEWVTATP